MKKGTVKSIALCMMLMWAIAPAYGANPYLPLWEHIPDGEPYIFADPDNPGKQRVYIYGSHDTERDAYCGRDLVVWSASPDSLNVWRYDGVIFESKKDAIGRDLNSDGRGDALFAPDVAERILPDGSRMYYLYPNVQGERATMLAVSARPDGPFRVINWNAGNPRQTIGVLGFDPALFIDDDGRVYAYWGFGTSYAAELDSNTMATVKDGTEIVKGLVSGQEEEGIGRFFEASSIRKIGDKYVFIYSRMAQDGEWGMPGTNYTLAYAYSDNPLGPYTFGGTIIDCRGRDTDAQGQPIATATPNGNTHGSIAEINGQWWVFFHRQTGVNEYSRQAMVAPITVEVEPGPGGKVKISEAEYTSEGFETSGLDPFKKYPAAIASHFTGPKAAYQTYPTMNYFGPYFEPVYIEDHTVANPYDLKINMNPVVNIVDKSIIGYKYYNFNLLKGKKNVRLNLDIIPEKEGGSISVYASAPWKGKARKIGEVTLNDLTPGNATMVSIPLGNIGGLKGKHPLYLQFRTNGEGSLCKIHYIQFSAN